MRFSDDPEVFYECFRADIVTTERSSRRIGSADVTFHCQPYTYYNAGDIFRTASACRDNPYDRCLPVYRVTATDEAWMLTVNGNSLQGSQSCYIDIEKQETTTFEGEQINRTIYGDYLEMALEEGENEISITGGTVRIKPRWRSV